MSIWRELGIKRTRDRVAIARAYAGRLAEIDAGGNPGADPDRAESLCAAYRRAYRFCDAMESGPVPRIAPRGPNRVKHPAARTRPVRPRRNCPARALEVGRAVAELTRPVAVPLRHGDQRGAIGALRGLFRDPLFDNARLRWAVERRLLEAVDALKEAPLDFAAAAIAAFHWDRDPRHLPPRAREVADRLCAIAEGERRVAGLRRAARHWAVRMWFDRRALAAALITGPYRPVLFRLAMLDPLTVRAIRRVLRELRAHHAPAATLGLNRSVIAWWDDSLGAAASPPARPERAA